jgi:hypothetical protein
VQLSILPVVVLDKLVLKKPEMEKLRSILWYLKNYKKYKTMFLKTSVTLWLLGTELMEFSNFEMHFKFWNWNLLTAVLGLIHSIVVGFHWAPSHLADQNGDSWWKPYEVIEVIWNRNILEKLFIHTSCASQLHIYFNLLIFLSCLLSVS